MIPSLLNRFGTLGLVSCLTIAGSVVWVGCDDDDGITPVSGTCTIELSLTGLQTIVGGLNYQAWLVVKSGNGSFGYPLFLFNIDEDGRIVHPLADTVLSGPFQADADAESVLGVAISLEISDTLQTQFSSPVLIMGGENIQGTATLTAEDWIAFNRDLSGAAGQFILATPTDENPDNELSGVWFTDPTRSDPSLILPEAPKGWVYEGWLEVDGETITTGKFAFPNLPDSAAGYSGPIEGPSYPGEDFLFNPPGEVSFPVDPAGGTVFLTVEPGGEWDVFPSAPFFIRLLEGQIPAEPVSSVSYTLTSNVADLPSGTATIRSP